MLGWIAVGLSLLFPTGLLCVLYVFARGGRSARRPLPPLPAQDRAPRDAAAPLRQPLDRYVADGLCALQVFLVQQARRAPRTDV